jgi:hypothetical protein
MESGYPCIRRSWSSPGPTDALASSQMSSSKVRLWGLGCIAGLVSPLPLFVPAFAGYWDGGEHSVAYVIAFVLSAVAMGIYLVTLVAAIVHTTRRDDLQRSARNRWLVALVVLNGFVLPYFWFRLIRPLGERGATVQTGTAQEQ